MVLKARHVGVWGVKHHGGVGVLKVCLSCHSALMYVCGHSQAFASLKSMKHIVLMWGCGVVGLMCELWG